jgi:hypothetical protein
LAKRWGDTVLWWQVNDLMDYSSSAKAQARAETDQMYAVIQEKEFPFWADSLETLKTKIETKTLKAEDLSLEFESGGTHVELLIKQLQPRILALIDLMGEKEFKNLTTNYRKKIEKEKAEAEKTEDQQEKIQDRYVAGMEFFLGDIEKNQEKLIEAFFATEIYPYKLQAQDKFRYLEMIEGTKGDKEKLKALANDFLHINNSIENRELQAAKKIYFQKLSQLTFTLLDQMSDKQRTFAVKKITQVSADLRAGTTVAKNP